MIRVYSQLDPYYHGYYVEGLFERAHREGRCLRFSHRSFPSFDRLGLAFIAEPGGRRFYVDADDTDEIDQAAARWCDVYGKVNLDQTQQRVGGPRIVALGPSFGIRCTRLLLALPSFGLGRMNLKAGGARWLRWTWMLRRQPLSAYRPARGERDNLFLASSEWAPEDDCNEVRARFMTAAKARPDARFHGGFVPAHRSDVPSCAPHRIEHTYSTHAYLKAMAQSAVAFNTPAVINCHGWKLGEFLALGKAILSTPLTRDMPEPLVHGDNVHFVGRTQEEIADGLDRLLRDDSYRARLGDGARRYFERLLAPGRVIDRLFDEARVTVAAGRQEEDR